jgi:hypothetical protein
VKADTALKMFEQRPQGDSWTWVKPGSGAYVESLSTHAEWQLMDVFSDCTQSNPLTLLIDMEDGRPPFEEF